MERKIGEIFTYNGKTYQVVETNACKDCAFKVRLCEAIESITGTCIPGERTDNTSVSFKLINNMEIKNNQLTIDIPEGMEIDLENSDLTKGIVKFKKKNITYDDILQSYATDFGGIRVPNHCIDKVLAISKLANIAKYYNKNWRPSWISPGQLKYYIYYSNENNKYQIGATTRCDYGAIYFRLRDYIQAVIDNPNFRDILDAIYKN
jgi:hypothetical protein